MQKLFEAALGIQSPWYVKSIQFDIAKKRLDIDVDFERGSRFRDAADEDVDTTYKVHDTVQKEWRHLNFFEHECYLKARVPRIKRDDGKVRLVSPPWSGVMNGFTLLFEALLIQLCKAMPVHNVAQLVGISDYLIWQILDNYTARAKAGEDLSGIERVGMDETSIARGHDYITLFVDLEERKTVHISEGKSSQTIVDFVEVLESKSGCREQVKDVSCDMSPAFIKGVRENLPNAEVTFDKFHIMKIINDGVDKVRRAEAKTNPLLKGARYAVLKNDANLTVKQRTTKDNLLATCNLKTVQAMQMRETFQQLYHLDNVAEFERMLREWCDWVEESELPDMQAVKRMVEAHWDGIVRWQESKINNGILEGLNSILQAAKRKARGYKFEHFKVIAYLMTGKLDFSRVNKFCLPT
ncbi:MAG: ISL3 family transposase [Ghiorsea sp.]|nr:ISL3 family transposase [Ghiorsea sp.]